jgi:hypothetical protein
MFLAPSNANPICILAVVIEGRISITAGSAAPEVPTRNTKKHTGRGAKKLAF